MLETEPSDRSNRSEQVRTDALQGSSSRRRAMTADDCQIFCATPRAPATRTVLWKITECGRYPDRICFSSLPNSSCCTFSGLNTNRQPVALSSTDTKGV
jgi:hypothetical protein